MKIETMKDLCFVCDKPTQPDLKIVGRWICHNQRCSRFGLVTSIVVQPERVTPVKKNDKIIQRVGNK